MFNDFTGKGIGFTLRCRHFICRENLTAVDQREKKSAEPPDHTGFRSLAGPDSADRD